MQPGSSAVVGQVFWLDPHLYKPVLEGFKRKIIVLGGTVRPQLDGPVDYVVLAESRQYLPAPTEPELAARKAGHRQRT